MLREVFEFFLHIDDALKQLTSTYGNWTYAILGMVIFCETGLVITPFLPGDSLLFAAGAIAADPTAGLSPVILYLIVTVMA
ncbi:MAG: hypothetical protein EBS29_10575, partial [Chloroflexia bacterium]|nr:hypothetical protein [Chloroflexia bacterium]